MRCLAEISAARRYEPSFSYRPRGASCILYLWLVRGGLCIRSDRLQIFTGGRVRADSSDDASFLYPDINNASTFFMIFQNRQQIAGTVAMSSTAVTDAELGVISSLSACRSKSNHDLTGRNARTPDMVSYRRKNPPAILPSGLGV